MLDSSQTVNTKFSATDNVSPAIRTIGSSVDMLNGGLSRLNRLGSLVGLTAGISSIAAIGTAVVSSVNKAISEYEEYTQQQAKLITIMHQRMDANEEMVESINNLMEAQENLGVVDVSIQAAGAQQMATFVHSTAALKSLIPAMNDLAVQQRGYQATDEDMVHIANMMGRVMDGQAGALRRVGISLSDEDEKLLKTLPEQERAALLAKVITQNVGNMNEVLSKTPEGQKVQALNKLSAAWRELGSRLAGIKDSIEMQLASGQLNILESIGSDIAITFSIISNSVLKAIQLFEWFGSIVITLAENFYPLIAATSLVYAGFKAVGFAEAAYATITGTATAATAGHTAAVAFGNAVLAVHRVVIYAAASAMLAYRSGTILATIGQAALNGVMLLCPALWVAAIIMGVVAALAVMSQAMGGAREMAAEAWQGIVSIVQSAVNKIIGFINLFIRAMNTAASFSNKLFHTGFTPVNEIGYVDWSRIGAAGANSIRNGTVIKDITNALAPKMPDVSQYMENSGIGSAGGGIGDLNNTAGDINQKVGKIGTATQKIADKIEMTDEEITALRETAQKGVLQNYQAQHIIVNIKNENHIASDVDLTGITGNLVKGIQEAIGATRKGISARGIV